MACLVPFLLYPWFFALTLFAPETGNTTELIIDVQGITETTGSLLIGIYDQSDLFPKDGKAMRELVVPVDAKQVRFTVGDLAEGTYAVALCHDVNNDGEFNTNFVGMPLEPYGFSNNVKPTLRAPSFESASFELEGRVVVTIVLQR